MLSLVFKPFWHLYQLVNSCDSPTQIAGGFTLGVVMGLLPMGNLIAIMLGCIICAVRVNKAAGCLAGFLFMWVGPYLDPIAHPIGAKLLSLPSLQEFYTWLYDMPLGPWLGFNNTVVLGIVTLGLYFSYPIFWLSYVTCLKLQPIIAKRRRDRELRKMVCQMKLGAEWGKAA